MEIRRLNSEDIELRMNLEYTVHRRILLVLILGITGALTLLLSLGGCAGGTDGTNTATTPVSGIIATRDGTAIQGAVLTSESGAQATSNADGLFELAVPPADYIFDGEITLHISAPALQGNAAFSYDVSTANIPANATEIQIGLTADYPRKIIESTVIDIKQGDDSLTSDSGNGNNDSNDGNGTVPPPSNLPENNATPDPTTPNIVPAPTATVSVGGPAATPTLGGPQINPSPTIDTSTPSQPAPNPTIVHPLTPIPTATPRGRPDCTDGADCSPLV